MMKKIHSVYMYEYRKRMHRKNQPSSIYWIHSEYIVSDCIVLISALTWMIWTRWVASISLLGDQRKGWAIGT